MTPKALFFKLIFAAQFAFPSATPDLGRDVTASDALGDYGGIMEIDCGGRVSQCNIAGRLNDGQVLTNNHCFPGGKSCKVLNAQFRYGIKGVQPIQASCSGLANNDASNDMAIVNCKMPASVKKLPIDTDPAKPGDDVISVHRQCMDKGEKGVKCEGAAHLSEGKVTGKEKNVMAMSTGGGNVIDEVTQTTNNACVGSSGSGMHRRDGALKVLLNSGKGECGAAGGISGDKVGMALSRMGVEFEKADGASQSLAGQGGASAPGSSAAGGLSAFRQSTEKCSPNGGFEKVAAVGVQKKNISDFVKFSDEILKQGHVWNAPANAE